MTLSRVSPVQALVARLRLALLLSVLASLTLLALPTFASAVVVPNANPNLTSRCGLNVMVVLDESGSIWANGGGAANGATAAVRNGAMTFVKSLKDTGSKVAMIEFNTNARKAIGYTTVTSTNAAEDNNAGSTFHRYLFDGGPTPNYNPQDDYNTDAAATNWEDALDQVIAANAGSGTWAGSPKADLVVFITDGNPTAWIDDGDNSTQFVGGTFSSTALQNAIPKANAVKTSGSHMFVVGVGDGVTDATSQSHMADISGPDKYPSPTPTFGEGDYMTVDNFGTLEATLKNLATELCKSSITVTKQVDEGTGNGYQPANGWDFTADVSAPGGITWVQPAGLNPQTATTTGAGTAAFQWQTTTNGALSAATITETQKPNYSIVDATCLKNNAAVATPLVGSAFSLSGLTSTDVVTCTVRNKRDTGTIEVKKTWVGGPSQTTLKIGTTAGASDKGSQLTDANGTTNQTTGLKTLPTGTYYVSETAVSNYDKTLVCTNKGSEFTPGANDAITLAKGDQVVCTYTNTKKGSIELKKAWVGTPGTTTLKIGTTSGGQEIDSQDTANGLTTGPNPVSPGTYHLSESVLADYDGVLTCTGGTFTAGQTTVGVAAGQTVVCTYTNTRKKGSIELKKTWVGTPGTTTLKIGTSAGGQQVDSQDTANGLTTGSNPVDPGTYHLSETALADYDSLLTCTGGGSFSEVNKTVVVDSNQTVVCTYTNTRQQGTVKLIKKLTGSATDRFNLNLGGTPQVTTGNSTSFGNNDETAVLPVNTGPYTVAETAVFPADLNDYAHSLSCINKGNVNAPDTDGSITVAKDDAWVCTFTNVKSGTVTIKKLTNPVSTDGPFGFTGTAAGAFNLNGGDTKTVSVAPGSYTAIEGVNADYDLSSISCNDTDSTGDANARTATFNVAAGEDITCTFTNAKKPKLELKKATVPTSDTGTFNLLADEDGAGTTQVAANGVGNGQGSGVTKIVPGTYSLSEDVAGSTVAAQYTMGSPVCATRVGGNPVSSANNKVTLAAGDDVICTWTNTKKGKVTIKKVTDPVSSDGPFGFTGTLAGSFDLNGGGSKTVYVPAGIYSATEDDPSGDGYLLDAVSCNDTASIPSKANRTVSVNVPSGGDVTCTFTNRKIDGQIHVVKSPAVQNVYAAGSGSTANYTYVVTNPGTTPVSNVVLGDDKCPAVSAPDTGADATPTILNPGDSWSYSCSISAGALFGGGTADITNTATVTGKDELNNPVTDTDTAVTKLLQPEIKVVKGPNSQTVYADGSASYTYTVTNPGNTPLDGVTISDDKCSPLSSADKTADTVGTTDTLDPGDTWTYTCSIGGSALFGGTTAPITNTVTVTGTDTVKDREVSDTDTAETSLLRPEIKVEKTPGSQSVLYSGDATYTYSVTNPGNTPLDTVSVSDDKCPSVTGPDKGADATTATLDPGETWTFTCTISAHDLFGASPSVDASVTNTATATGKDTIKGKTVTDTDTAVTDLQTGELILEKQLNPSTDPGRFELKHNGTSATVFGTQGTAFGNNESNSITVLAGEPITISESAVSADHPLSDYTTTKSCERVFIDEDSGDGNKAIAIDGPLNGDVVTVPAYQTIRCTFVNTKKAKITIKKVVSNPETGVGPQFGFATDLPGGAFNLRHNETTSQLVEAGEVPLNVSENDPSGIDGGYKLTGIVCTDDSPTQVNLAQRSVSITPSAGADITCTFTNKRIVGLDVVVKAPKTQAIYRDGTATYTYQVTNTGTSDLTGITVADDKCPSVTGPNTGTDATPTVLNTGDVWTYTCSISASALFGSTSAPITNTVTVNAKDELGRSTLPAKDTAVTSLLVPGIALAKTVAPASQSAVAGDAITFNITVTNTGNTSMPTVAVSDDLCPANLSAADKTGDVSPTTLDPGETWSYTCVVQSTSGQAGSTIVNTASVNGTDTGGKTVSANGNASITLPANPVIGQGTKGTARVVASSAGCVKSAYGTAAITGTNIKQVTFYVNGKLFKRLTRANSGKNYKMQLKAKGLKYGTYKISAKVQFVTGASPASKTLNVQFSRCRPRVVIQPKFTG